MAITAKKRTSSESLGLQNEEQTRILKVLAYFDIFQYPLSQNEIRQFLGDTSLEAGLDKVLQQMLASQTIFFHNGFYSLHNNPLLSHKRVEGNQRAEKLLPKADKIGRFLFLFPFVRAIGISGSLSKNFADENADIDYFIITKMIPTTKPNEYTITGNLTLKGISNAITFPAIIITEGDKLKAQAAVTIDRTLWGITYKSYSFLSHMKDDLIPNNIKLTMNLVFNKAIN